MSALKSDFSVPVRAPLVVLFVETRGFTRISEILEPAVVIARLSEFFALVTGAVERYDGVVIDILNDDLIAAFDGEGDSMRAVQAAQDSTAAISEFTSFEQLRSIHAGKGTFQFDRIGGKLIDDMGVESLMWGSDYPHFDGAWPDSAGILASQFEGVPLEDQRKIGRGNAIDLYNLPLAP